MLWLFKAAKARFDPGEDPWSEQAKRRRQSRARLLAETNKKSSLLPRRLNKRHAAVASDYVSERCILYKSSPILNGTLQTAAHNRENKMNKTLELCKETDNEYKIVWEIDVIASSPEDAAKQALAIQRDPESHALVFHVQNWKQMYTVDLMDNVLNGEVV